MWPKSHILQKFCPHFQNDALYAKTWPTWLYRCGPKAQPSCYSLTGYSGLSLIRTNIRTAHISMTIEADFTPFLLHAQFTPLARVLSETLGKPSSIRRCVEYVPGQSMTCQTKQKTVNKQD